MTISPIRKKKMDIVNKYEKQQISAIQEWKNKTPTGMDKTFSLMALPLAWVLDWITTDESIQETLIHANDAAADAADHNYLLEHANIKSIPKMKDKTLEECDKFALEAQNWGLATATTGGTLIGAAGVCSISSDIHFVITLALRTIHNIGLCYGYAGKNDEYRQFVLGILAASAANSQEEKDEALQALGFSMQSIPRQAKQSIASKATANAMAKGAKYIGLNSLAERLGINITKRKALQAVPAFGAFVGGSVNWLYLHDVSIAARRIFQERWLRENDKLY